MNTYLYEVPGKLNSTEDIPVHLNGQHVYTINRIYDNGLKKLMDAYFDYRYFLKYVVKSISGEERFVCRKVQRKGRLWFEGKDFRTNQQFIITYENWRIGVPELFIKGEQLNMKIDKEMEEWSNFLVGETVVARWLAVYHEEKDLFSMTLEILPDSPVQDAAFFLAIAQSTLFIGA
ncbi:peptide ABC transporter ATPase [Lysinibacillus sp. 3P01SB]|uniref:tubby C-terminal domain-like protein n=1 Tax=Lysinibacillus sp. 3P01SB TaxID=3132284 RepID=UPI0039A5EE97